MKSTTLIGILVLTLLNHSCGEQPLPSAKSTITVKVLDDAGKTLEGITVRAGYFDKITNPEGFGSASYKFKEARTNHEGKATVSNNTRDSTVGIGLLNTTGFYEDYGYEHEYKSQSGGTWQPDNPLIEFKLKPIKNPIPLHAKNVELEIPKTDAWFGYDFEKGDLVQPHGIGVTSDIIFHLKRRYVTYHDYEAALEIKFPNNLDGAMLLDIEPLQKGSILKMPYLAPEEGYSAPIVNTKYITPKKPILETNVSDRNYYFVRVRSVTDQNGNLLKANYAKIHNDFRYDVISSTKKNTAIVLFRYYYNPTANDRNLEFDMKKNLFKNLPSEEVPLSP